MHKGRLLLVALFVVLMVIPALVSAEDPPESAGQEEGDAPSGVAVAEGVIAVGIEARQPVGASNSFPNDVGKLYCWTKITGAAEPIQILHRWKRGDEVKAGVSLEVRGSPWRIFSSKTILPEWTGEWSVEVVFDGTVIETLNFVISE